MGRNYLAALKLALALVCVGLVILVVAHWIGIVPGADDTVARRRRDFVDSVITMTVDDVSQSHWTDLRDRLQRVVDRQPDLMSIGVRTSVGELKTTTRQHNEIWNVGRAKVNGQASATKLISDTGNNKLEPVVVSLSIHKRHWGQVEFAFAKDSLAGDTWFGTPLVRLLIFYFVCGTTIYACFVIRVLGVFRKTQVVPDDVRVALDTLTEGLLLLDGQSRIRFANQAFAKSVDSSPRRLEGSAVDELAWQPHHGEDEDPHLGEEETEPLKPWKTAIETGSQQFGTMLQLVDRQSESTVFSINVTPLQKGSVVESSKGVLVTFRDVTLEQRHKNELQEMLRLLGDSRDEIEQKNRRLEILATRDSLTGCLNRRAFFEKFDLIWEASKRDGLNLSTMMIDIDHFKSVNDTYGHHTGDEVLRAVSSVLRQRHDDDGIVCRYGGEEFCVLLPGVNVEAAAELAEQTRIAITKLLFDEPAELRLTASLGISELRFDANEPQSLINQADACLYVAKREGRNRVIVYNPSMTVEPIETESSAGLDDSYQLPEIAINVLTRTLSHCDAALSRASRRIANRAMRWTENCLDQNSRYLLEIGLLLHRIDRLGSDVSIISNDHATTEVGQMTNGGVLQQIVDGLCNEHLSKLFRDYRSLLQDTSNQQDPQVGSKRSIESQWMILAILYDQTHGEVEERIRQTLSLVDGWIDPSIVQQLLRQSSPTDDIAKGVLQLQQYMSEAIATEISGMRSAVKHQNFDSLRKSIQNLDAFSRDSNLSSISQAVKLLGGDDRGSLQTLQTLCQQGDWALAEQIISPLNDVCRDVQASLLAFSMDVCHNSSPPQQQKLTS